MTAEQLVPGLLLWAGVFALVALVCLVLGRVLAGSAGGGNAGTGRPQPGTVLYTACFVAALVCVGLCGMAAAITFGRQLNWF